MRLKSCAWIHILLIKYEIKQALGIRIKYVTQAQVVKASTPEYTDKSMKFYIHWNKNIRWVLLAEEQKRNKTKNKKNK